MSESKLILYISLFILMSCQREVKVQQINRNYSYIEDQNWDTIYIGDSIKALLNQKNYIILDYFSAPNQISRHFEFYKDSLISNFYWFYETGVIKEYRFYDEYFETCYILDYDENGKITREEGVIVSPNITELSNINDTLKIKVMIPNPPLRTSVVESWISDMDGFVFSYENHDTIDYAALLLSKYIKFKSDTLILNVAGVMFDNYGNLIKKDTIRCVFEPY